MPYKTTYKGIGITVIRTLFFFMLHIFIALLLRGSSGFSTFYANFIFFMGVIAVLSGRRLLVACIIGYITGAEVLFRMTGADVFWEYGKYAVIGILVLALIFRFRKFQPKSITWNIILILYFFLLLPAIALTPFESFTQWRQDVSFNMSGHFSVLVCGLYFSGLTLDKKDLQKIFTCLIAPVVSMAFIVLVTLIQSQYIDWGYSSRKVASGLFGPNQVGSVLGLGTFLCLVFYVLAKENRILKIIFISFSVWFFAHSILTLSRGGVFGAALSALIFLIALVRTKKNRFIALGLGIFFISLNHYYIVPKLNQYTEGFLEKRYAMRERVGEREIIETGGRLELAKQDIRMFKDNMLQGVGVGNAQRIRIDVMGGVSGAHTEWTNILAEHGTLGLFSLILLWAWILKRYRSMKDPLSKAISLSFIVFIIFYMAHSAMRLVIPGFLIGFLGADIKCAE